jgi:transcriptional/translational regulatory protein YebC/TACO1
VNELASSPDGHSRRAAHAADERQRGGLVSGHSKWATTKHKKAGIDAKRGKLFAKLIKNIEVAARTGGGDPAGNPTLFDAIQKAKKSSVPNDNIDARSSGCRSRGRRRRLPDDHLRGLRGRRRRRPRRVPDRQQEPVGHGGAHGDDRNGGSMADPGSVSYLFSRKGVIVVPKSDGATRTPCSWPCSTPVPRRCATWRRFEVVCEPTDLVAVRTALQDAGIDYDSADAGFVPSVSVELDEEAAGKVFRLIDALEDCDDVQNVYANYDVSDEVLEKVG